MENRKFMPTAPNQTVLVLAVIIGILGILGYYIQIDILTKYNYEMLLIPFNNFFNKLATDINL